MKRLIVLVALLGILGAAMLPGAASAHPLGNFTVNHFAAVDLAGNGVYVRYALDLAEIPTFQEGAEVRKPGYAAAPRAQPRSARRRQARAADRPLPSHFGAAGCRRAEDDALRRGLPRRGDGLAADVRRSRLREPDRLARDRRHRPQRRARRRRARRRRRAGRTSSAPTRRACSARRSTSRSATVEYTPGQLGGAGPHDRGRAGARAPKRRLRVADPARRPLARRDPALAR